MSTVVVVKLSKGAQRQLVLAKVIKFNFEENLLFM